MQANGNGLPMQCVANLVRIVRGECTYVSGPNNSSPTINGAASPIIAFHCPIISLILLAPVSIRYVVDSDISSSDVRASKTDRAAKKNPRKLQ